MLSSEHLNNSRYTSQLHRLFESMPATKSTATFLRFQQLLVERFCMSPDFIVSVPTFFRYSYGTLSHPHLAEADILMQVRALWSTRTSRCNTPPWNMSFTLYRYVYSVQLRSLKRQFLVNRALHQLTMASICVKNALTWMDEHEYYKKILIYNYLTKWILWDVKSVYQNFTLIPKKMFVYLGRCTTL